MKRGAMEMAMACNGEMLVLECWRTLRFLESVRNPDERILMEDPWKIHGSSTGPSCEASQLRWEPFLETDARPLPNLLRTVLTV